LLERATERAVQDGRAHPLAQANDIRFDYADLTNEVIDESRCSVNFPVR
jgi:hypothetical protein